MTTLLFLTSGKISYTLTGSNLYESIQQTARGFAFPGLTNEGRDMTQDFAEGSLPYAIDAIYSAPSNQCFETAKIIAANKNLKVVEIPELLPLRFSLETLLTPEEFENLEDQRFRTLRERFLESFTSDTLLDSQNDFITRFEHLKAQMCAKHPKKTVILVSHAYLIRLFSIYHEIGQKMFTDKKLLTNMFQPEVEPMGRLEIQKITL